jgi:hypothetical protein
MSEDLDQSYRALDLQPGASLEEVKASWRILVKVWHPDRFPDDAKLRVKAEEQLKLINAAYELLREFHTAPSTRESTIQKPRPHASPPVQASDPDDTPPSHTPCFGCGARSSAPYAVNLKRINSQGLTTFRTLHVPLCSVCSETDTKAYYRKWRICFAVMVGPPIVFLIAFRELGVLITGAAFGFLGSICASVVLKQHPIAEKHPDVIHALKDWQYT